MLRAGFSIKIQIMFPSRNVMHEKALTHITSGYCSKDNFSATYLFRRLCIAFFHLVQNFRMHEILVIYFTYIKILSALWSTANGLVHFRCMFGCLLNRQTFLLTMEVKDFRRRHLFNYFQKKWRTIEFRKRYGIIGQALCLLGSLIFF